MSQAGDRLISLRHLQDRFLPAIASTNVQGNCGSAQTTPIMSETS